MHPAEPDQVQPISALRDLRTIAGAVLVYVFLWSVVRGFLYHLEPGLSSNPVETVLMGGVYGFILFGGLVFLTLHLPLLLAMQLVLPGALVRYLPVLSVIVASLLSFWLRYLYDPWLGSNGSTSAWMGFCASSVTALVAGFILVPRPQEATFSRAAVALSTATIVLCLAGFLYYTFVSPGHYHYDDKMYERVDWLTGRMQESVAEGVWR